MPSTMATYVYASSQGQRTHSARTNKKATIEQHVPFWPQDDLNIDYDALDSDEENFPHTQQQNPNHERPVPSPTSLALEPEDNPAESLTNNPQDSTPELSRSTRTQPPGCSTQRPSTSSRTQPILSNKERVVFDGMVTVSHPVPDDVFFDVDEVGLNTSHESGTPANSETGDDVDEEAMMLRMTEEIDKQDELRGLMKATDIRKLLSGSECDNVVLQIFNFEKIGRGKCYRAHGQNGILATTRMTFSANLNERVIEMDKKLPIVRISSYQLYNGSFMFVKDFEVLQIVDIMLGSPEYLTEKDYEDMKNLLNPNENLPQTPSMVKRKLTDKHVEQLNVKPRSMYGEQTWPESCGHDFWVFLFE